MTHLLHDHDGMTIYVGCPETIDGRNGRLLLATFYEGLLGVQDRLEDTPERVEIDLDDKALPNLAFQQAPLRDYRHPDPAYPAQLHVDYEFGDDWEVAIERGKRLGAINIPSPDRPDRTDTTLPIRPAIRSASRRLTRPGSPKRAMRALTW